MITCPSCNHQNPEGSLQCENCYTPLPATTSCPNCGTSVQTDATFCGQCGFNLQAESSSPSKPLEETAIGGLPNMSSEEVALPEEMPLSDGSTDIMPETAVSSSIQSPWDDVEDSNDIDEENFTIAQTSELPRGFPEIETRETIGFDSDSSDTAFAEVEPSLDNEATMSWEANSLDLTESPIESEQSETTIHSENEEDWASETSVSQANTGAMSAIGVTSGVTQLQIQTASLLHLQSNTTIEIPPDLDVVHLGKPNGQIPPDIDVAGFPDSEVVSRVHADIRIEGDALYLEDVGSSNGTYVNHAPLVKGNRHRLRAGDRIALGKGDLVTFIFQLN